MRALAYESETLQENHLNAAIAGDSKQAKTQTTCSALGRLAASMNGLLGCSCSPTIPRPCSGLGRAASATERPAPASDAASARSERAAIHKRRRRCFAR